MAMLPDYGRMILLVEDDPIHYKGLMRRMRKAGYTPTLAKSYSEARSYLEARCFHLAVVDICLDNSRGVNEDGLRLLEDIERLGLLPIMPVIVLTGYPSLDRMLVAREKRGATSFIRKDPQHYGNQLLAKIKELFEREIRINFDLEYEGNSLQYLAECAADIHEAETDWSPLEILIPQIRDLMGKHFARAASLRVQRMPKGLSGSAILRVQPTYPSGGIGQWLVVKVGRRKKTEIESRNYQDHVEHFLPANHTTQLSACYTRDLGGLVYTLNTDLSSAYDFQEFYRAKPAAEIVSALRSLFRETCAMWYQSHTPPRNLILRDIYLDTFELKDKPERIPTELFEMRPKMDRRSTSIQFDSPTLLLPNPLRWLDEIELSHLPVSLCITHGDLHAGNILMNEQGECWLIDFYRTRQSHILRDIVKLEVDIKFNLLPVLASPEYYEFESALLRLMPEELNPPLSAGSAAEEKAMQVIGALRAEAWRLLDWNGARAARRVQIKYEYLFALLMTTLNVLRLRHYKETPRLQPYRELALLSAALICRELEKLNPTR